MKLVRKVDNKEFIYDVTYNCEALNELRTRVIEEASQVTHHDYTSPHGPFYRRYMPPDLDIRNYKKISEGIKPWRMFEEVEIFRFIYDEYKYPYLVTLIDGLINGDEEVLDEIINPDFKQEFDPIKSSIQKLENKLFDLDLSKVKDKMNILNALKELYEVYEKHEYKLPIEKYYEELQGLLKYELKSTKELKKTL